MGDDSNNNNRAEDATEGTCHDINALLTRRGRDYLVRNNGDKVKVEKLRGKTLGLYFSASWCLPCLMFTPKLMEVYDEVSSKGNFEVIFVSADADSGAFSRYFSKMPWLAVPFSDSMVRKQLNRLFKVTGIPTLVILDEKGMVSSEEGVKIIHEYGAEGYPFSSHRFKEIQEEAEAARREQSLRSLLASPSRDFVISNDGNKVPISELEGKIVGLYFLISSSEPCLRFTPTLVKIYEKLKNTGRNFEIVMISLDEEEDFKACFESMPWMALPSHDENIPKLFRYFDLPSLPALAIIGADGKTLHPDAVEDIAEHGAEAYPFTPERFAELKEIEKAKEEAQTLESVLVFGDQDFVIRKDGTRVPVADLVGKTILLYFSASWCGPCRRFLPKLIESYHQINRENEVFEVVLISMDRDQASFDEFFSQMPWLAVPFGDERNAKLSKKFKVRGIPTAVAIGPNGRTVSTEAVELINNHGAKAYPFTAERAKQLEEELQEMAKGWPDKVKSRLHKRHELVLTSSRNYSCDGCHEDGNNWSFCCRECNFDLHPKCALEGGTSHTATENICQKMMKKLCLRG